MIKILKASAGSGKTFHLAKTYIELLFRSTDLAPYRHILAVTFTNKATDEMKSRILKELDILARDPESSNYWKDFSKEFGGKEEISRKASKLLVDILHDYSAFAVSTIDKFFQQTLKAFAREIGQFASYQVELDKESLVRESVDRILDSVSESDRTMLRWLTESVMEQVEQGDKFNLEKNLYTMANSLKSDEHRTIVEERKIDEEKVYDKERLTGIRKVCNSIIPEFEKELKASIVAVLQVLADTGVSPSDFKGASRSFMCTFVNNFASYEAGLDFKPPTPGILKNAVDTSNWFKPNDESRFLPLVEVPLSEALRHFVDLFDAPYKAYSTAVLIKKQLYCLGIASQLYKEFSALQKEKNVLSIDDSNTILRRIIDGSDAPFVYEKLGVRYENFLLDEFQDTAIVQWDNFRPLLKESDSNGNDNLLVGDVKQSIYRWRGSQWTLLDSVVKKNFPSADDSESLSQNWRSLRNIVEFNNRFFVYAAQLMDSYLDNGGQIRSIYNDKDVAQTPMSGNAACGSVEVTFCEKEAEIDQVISSIWKAHDAGARNRDITVLVRSNEKGSEIADALVREGLPVISDDSLRVKSSVSVRRLTSLLSYADNPEDKVNGYLAKMLDIPQPSSYRSLEDLCEYLICHLREYDPVLVDKETLYIQSFVDQLQDWTSVNGNSLSGFLKYWADADPKLSSPADTDAITVMTIHKSKGLEAPYVIVPFVEGICLYRKDNHWSCPELSGTVLEGVAEGAYNVTLSEHSLDTYFAEDYTRERQLQFIDNLNVFYVALTRAKKALHVIAATPPKKLIGKVGPGIIPEGCTDMSQILYSFVESNLNAEEGWGGFRRVIEDSQPEENQISGGYLLGSMYDFSSEDPDTKSVTAIPAGFESYPLDGGLSADDQTDVRERGRLKFSSDAVDYFDEGGKTGAAASVRRKGLAMHSILSLVKSPSDLKGAVRHSVMSGDLTEEQGAEAFGLLEEAVAFGAQKGWFPENPDLVYNEISIIDPRDGSVQRPDRIVTDGLKAVVIDYKFGSPDEKQKSSYRRKISRYAGLCKSLGFKEVEAWLWYVESSEVERVK